MNPLVSVVIPVYNVEQVLGRCVDSVVCQSYQQLDIVLVDDGSTDNSGKICDDYAALDSRISVLHIRNGGVSNARNVGMQQARGEYVLFVDSDDEITIDYVHSFINIDVDKHKCLIIQGCISNLNGKDVWYQFPDLQYDKDNFGKCIIDGELYKHGSPYGKLYSLSLIKKNKICFNTQFDNYEDLLFFLDYIQFIDTIKYSSNLGYIYHITSSGLHLKYSSFAKECYLEKLFWEKMEPYMQDSKKDRISAYALYLLFRPLKSLYLNECSNRIIAIQKMIDDFNPLFVSSTIYLSFSQKVILFCLKRRWFGVVDKIYNLCIDGGV